MLQIIFAQEILSDQYQCENCNKETRAVQKYVIGIPFIFDDTFKKILDLSICHFRFSIGLGVQEFCSIKAKYKFRLIIIHQGTPERGHKLQNKMFCNNKHIFQYVKKLKNIILTCVDFVMQQTSIDSSIRGVAKIITLFYSPFWLHSLCNIFSTIGLTFSQSSPDSNIAQEINMVSHRLPSSKLP